MYIDLYRFGNIVIDGKSYSNDVILYPGGILTNWFRREGHQLCLDDIEEHLSGCRTLIVGTGASGMVRILPDLKDHCEKAHIQLIAKPTAEAVRLYNQADTSSTVGAFHLTC